MSDHRTTTLSSTFIFFSENLAMPSKILEFLLEWYKKGCPVLLHIVSFFFCCVVNHPIFTGIKEQPLYYTQDSMDQEFVKGTVGISWFCPMMSECSQERLQGLGYLEADIICSVFKKSGVAGTSAVDVDRNIYT